MAPQVRLTWRKGKQGRPLPACERGSPAMLFRSTYARHRLRHGLRLYVVKPVRTTAAASQERLPAVVPRGAASSDSLSVVLVTFAA